MSSYSTQIQSNISSPYKLSFNYEDNDDIFEEEYINNNQYEYE